MLRESVLGLHDESLRCHCGESWRDEINFLSVIKRPCDSLKRRAELPLTGLGREGYLIDDNGRGMPLISCHVL